MGTNERVTVDGVEVNPAGDLADAIAEVQAERPPATRYLLIEDGAPTGEVMWDGETPFDPGDGVTLTPTAEWKGEKYAGPPEDDATKAKRTFAERLDKLIDSLRDDQREFDSMTAAQRQASQKRALRAVILLARESRGDFSEE